VIGHAVFFRLHPRSTRIAHCVFSSSTSVRLCSRDTPVLIMSDARCGDSRSIRRLSCGIVFNKTRQDGARSRFALKRASVVAMSDNAASFVLARDCAITHLPQGKLLPWEPRVFPWGSCIRPAGKQRLPQGTCAPVSHLPQGNVSRSRLRLSQGRNFGGVFPWESDCRRIERKAPPLRHLPLGNLNSR